MSTSFAPFSPSFLLTYILPKVAIDGSNYRESTIYRILFSEPAPNHKSDPITLHRTIHYAFR
jgi:hypothetical protein